MMTAFKAFTVACIAILCVILYPHLTQQSIASFVQKNSLTAPLVFIALCALRPVLFFLPSMGLTVVAGLLFGPLRGAAYVVAGGALSTAVGFYFARWLGRSAVERLVARNGLLARIEQQFSEQGGRAVLYLRLFNLPWDMVSYWAGLSGIGFRQFYLASLVPLAPISLLYTYFGSTVYRPGSAGFIISLAVIFLLGALPFIKSRLSKKP